MKKIIPLLSILFASVAPIFADDYNPAMNVLDWDEEFNYAGLPLDRKWDYEVGYIRNNEAQYYTKADSNNVKVENGNLVITAIKDSNGKITSASINTLGKRHFFHGRLEVRVKVPTGKGAWPAIWAMGINRPQVNWPRCSEIDIMEYVGYNPYVFHNNVHTLGSKTTDVGAMNTSKQTTLSNAYSEWHVFALERTAQSIKFFIDGKLVFTYLKNSAHPDYWYGLDQPHYLLLNLAIGGSWGGQQGIDDAIFPAKYYVDYVRFYVAPDAPRKYVSKTGNDLNDGNSWATAYATLGRAVSLCDCSGGGEVWVAQGTYTEPTEINMRKNLTIYGGFAGSENSVAQRSGGETVFSGANKRRIFFNEALDNTAKLDRVTITNGAADMGAGIYNDAKSAVAIKDCKFLKNTAATNGGAVFNNNSNATFLNCAFTQNKAVANGGGAVFNNYFSSTSYARCTFSGNTALKGAGAYDSHSSPSIYDECVFENNAANSDVGGGFFSTGGCVSQIKNSLFISNTASRGGAAYMSSGDTTFTNCTFTKNFADGAPAIITNSGTLRAVNCTFAGNSGNWGGCLYAQGKSSAKVVNSIFKNNTGKYVTQIAADETSAYAVANSLVEGGINGENISTANPILRDLDDNGGFAKTFALRSDSPAVGKGASSTVFQDCAIPTLDARGKQRATPCTIGAYESIQPESYETWVSENMRGAIDTSDTARPYPDNLTNLERYAQSVSAEPIDASAPALKSAKSAPCLLRDGLFEFRQAKNAQGFDASAYFSFDLKNWFKTSTVVSDSTLPDAQIMQAIPPASSENKNVFYKLIITKKDLTQ